MAATWVVSFAAAWGIPVWLMRGSDQKVAMAVASAVAAWPLRFVSVFFGVAVVATVRRELAGEPARARDGVRDAARRIRPILAWSLLAAGVGVALDWLSRRIPAAGPVAATILGAAWSLVTLFVVPVLVVEGTGTPRAMRRSAETFRQVWGETAIGTISIGACVLVVMIPGMVCVGIGFMLGGAAAAIAVGSGVLLLALGLAVEDLLVGLFAFSLYRYATTDGTSAPIFGEGLLRRGFMVRRAKQRGD